MKYLPINEIKFPDNLPQPQDEDVDSMIESIKSIGRLLHPITVKDDGTLIAGRKRLLACKKLQWETIPCEVVSDETTTEECEIIRIHENLKRSNLPWYEQVILEKRLHDLRQQEHGVGKRGKKVGWSLRDTAQELEISFGVLSEDIRLAEAILADPSLKKVGDKTTARRVILRTLKRIEQEATAKESVEFEYDVVHLGSSEVVLQAYPNNSFDVCITDPPWMEYKDKSLTKDESTLLVFQQVYRVLKRDSFLYAFVSFDDFVVYREEFQKIGFNVQKYPNIWVKPGILSHGKRAWEYQRDYELIIIAVKGAPALSESMLSAVFTCPPVPTPKLIHPNEKPEALIGKILEHCTFEGSLVLDPFAGSGVVPYVAKKMGRRYVAIERNQEFYSKIVERLNQGGQNG